MDFGSLQIVTAWRLTRDGAMCQAIVTNGQEGFRLIVIEDQQIVSWESLRTIQDLRRQVAAALKARCQDGWEAAAPAHRVSRRKRSGAGDSSGASRFPTF
jgi:hypothetical protein